MKSFKLVIGITLISAFLLFCNSCAPEADLSLNLIAGSADTYVHTVHVRKDHIFDRPTEGTKRVRSTESQVDITFEQIIKEVDPDGNATADITIKALKFIRKDQDGVSVDYDSTKPSKKKNALDKMMGKSYTIVLSPAGKVQSVSNVAKARNAVKSGEFSNQAKNMLSDKLIKERHTIIALPDKDASLLKKGDSWSRVVSPKGSLIPKRYEKIYTVSDIDAGKTVTIATIAMNAVPTSKKSDDGSSPQISPLALVADFDSVDSYTGKLIINTKTGKIIEFYESLKTENTAAESPPNQDPDKGPDVLKIGFVEKVSLKAVD
jgi:hypothetical protein